MSSNDYMKDGNEDDDDIDFTQPHSAFLKEITSSVPPYPPTFGANKVNTIVTSELSGTAPINQSLSVSLKLDQMKPHAAAPTLTNINPISKNPAQVPAPALRHINTPSNLSGNPFNLVPPALGIAKSPSEPITKPTNLVPINQNIGSSSQMKFPPNIPGMALPKIIPPETQSIPEVKQNFPNIPKLITPETQTLPEVKQNFPNAPKIIRPETQTLPEVKQNFPNAPKLITPETQSLPEMKQSLPNIPKLIIPEIQSVSQVKHDVPNISEPTAPQFNSNFSPVSSTKFPGFFTANVKQGEPVIPPKFVPESANFKPVNITRPGEVKLPASLIPGLNQGKPESLIPSLNQDKPESLIPSLNQGKQESLIPGLNQGKAEFGSMAESNLLRNLPSNPKPIQDKHPSPLVNLNPSAPIVPNRKELGISSQQSFSISSNKKALSLSSFEYKTEHLSSIDPTSLLPLAFNSSYDQLDSTDLYSLISQVLPYIDINTSSYDPQDFSVLLTKTSDFNSVISEYFGCICGSPGTKKLTCRHSLCEDCIYSHTSCPKCYAPFSFYTVNSLYYKCLKCKLMKYKLHSCKHYCEDCVINELRTEERLECLLCPKVFKKEEALEKKASCSSCKSEGGYLIKGYHEVCIGHLLCFKCYKEATRNQMCYCGRKLETKELFRLKKRSRFVCSCCVKVRRITDLKVRNCCGSAACVKCQNNPECLFCKDKLE